MSVLTLFFGVWLALPQASSRATVILAIGDSMTAGYGVDAEFSYPAQLERQLNKGGNSYRVVNYGITGSTTAQALGRLDRAMAANPDIVIIPSSSSVETMRQTESPRKLPAPIFGASSRDSSPEAPAFSSPEDGSDIWTISRNQKAFW
jgi:hypothetical protein